MRITTSQDGKLRVTCGYGCGWRSMGIETRGQERVREQREQLERRIAVIRS